MQGFAPRRTLGRIVAVTRIDVSHQPVNLERDRRDGPDLINLPPADVAQSMTATLLMLAVAAAATLLCVHPAQARPDAPPGLVLGG
jgi:hypothetical protein